MLTKLRAQGKTTPVLIHTARDNTADKVAGLDAGADDYVVEPAELNELAARVRALTRRAAGHAQPVLRHAEREPDPAAHRVTLAGHPVERLPRKFALLETLLERPVGCFPGATRGLPRRSA